jgi:hypothetical protein
MNGDSVALRYPRFVSVERNCQDDGAVYKNHFMLSSGMKLVQSVITIVKICIVVSKMRIQILGTAALAVLLGFGTVPVQALSPCPLFGPDLPIPTALGDDVSIKSTVSEFLRLFPSLDIDFQNTSFSVDIYPAADKQPLFTYHHSAAYRGHGVQVVNDTTVYRIGSVSKLLTAYVYLLEVGDVSFNQPVTRYVPELADISAELRKKHASHLKYVDWDVITIGALASHMAGIPRDFPSPVSADRQLERLGFPPVRPVDFAYCGKSVLYPCNRTGTLYSSNI